MTPRTCCLVALLVLATTRLAWADSWPEPHGGVLLDGRIGAQLALAAPGSSLAALEQEHQAVHRQRHHHQGDHRYEDQGSVILSAGEVNQEA